MKKLTNIRKLFLAAALLFGVFQATAEAVPIPDGGQLPGLRNGSHPLLLIPVTLIGSLAVGIGLYDGNDPEITDGDLNSQDYWWTKFDAMMLDIALKQHQPEGRIGIDLAIALRRIDDLVKKYPKHKGIQQWKTRFEEIQSKINPDANRGASFGPECPWDESNFAQLWVNFHWIKLLVEQKDWGTAEPLMQNVQQNYKIMLAPDRMKNYPEDLRKWVTDSKPEADKLAALIKEKRGG